MSTADYLNYLKNANEQLASRGLIKPETYAKISSLPDPKVVAALEQVESGGNPNAVSSAGAQGVMQIMPDTFKEVAPRAGVDPNADPMKPEVNRAVGKQYLSELQQKYGNQDLALLAYHAGMGNVDKAISKVGNDPNAVEQYFAQNNMPRSAEYADKVNSRMQRMNAGYQQQYDAMSEGMLAQEKLNTQLLEEQTKQAQIQNDYATKIEQEENQRQEKINEARSTYQSAADALATQKIDPERFWGKQTTEDKIVAAIGIALGGFAAGMTGQRNTAMDVITRAIDQDLEAQRLELMQNEASARNKANLYNEILQQTNSERQTEATLYKLKLDAASSKIDAMSKVVKNQQELANLQKLQGEIMVKAEEKQAEMEKEALEKPEITAQITQNLEKFDIESLPEKIRERVVLVNNKPIGVARTTKDQEKVTEGLITRASFNRKIDELIADRKANPGLTLDSSFAKTQNSRIKFLVVDIKKMTDLGVLSSSDYELINGIIPESATSWNKFDRTFLGKDPVIEQLEEARKRTNDGVAQEVSARMTKFTSFGENFVTSLKSNKEQIDFKKWQKK